MCVAGWIGARVYHILTNWDYYRARPEEITQWGVGGLGIRGALLLGFAALWVYARVRRFGFGHLLDASALGLAIGQAIGWIGALVEGANYGVVSTSPLAQELPDLHGLLEWRFPVQQAETTVFVLLFLALVTLALQPRPAGQIFWIYLLIASLANATLGYQRGDPTSYIGAWRIDQLVDAALALIALAALATQRLRMRALARDSGRVMARTH